MVVSLVLYSVFGQATKFIPGLDDVMVEMGRRFKKTSKKAVGWALKGVGDRKKKEVS